MSHLYLVVLGADFDRERVVEYLDQQPGMAMWFYSMPHSFFIESSRSAQEISDLIKRKWPASNRRHFVTRVSREDHQGWMPADQWAIFNRIVR
jgi:hypothetical protein